VETRAHFALVGAVVIVMSLAAALFVIWLGKYSFDQETVEYDVVFDGPVRGLSDSSEVRFNGIQVGEVTRLGLDPSNPNRVIARVRVDALTPVKSDSVAQIEPQGLTGVSFIQITGGTPSAPPLRRRPGSGSPPVIFAKESPLEGFVSNAEEVMADASATLNQIEKVLSDENVETFRNLLESVTRVAEMVEENEALLAQVSEAVIELQSAAESVQKFADTGDSLLQNETRTALENIDIAARQVRQAGEDVAIASQNTNQMVEAFSEGGQAQINRLIADLQRLTEAAERVLGELEQSPSSFIAGAPREEVEIPQ